NGARKTTLMHLSMGLIEPSAGDVLVFGRSPHKAPAQVLAHVGFVAQDRSLYRNFTVRDMFTFGRKLNPRWDDDQARARMQQLEIPLNSPVGKLSGGQQAQVTLALVLAKRSELLLLDEPAAHLDPLARKEFQQTLLNAASTSHLTIVISSHILSDLERVCNYLIILSSSRIQLVGSTEQIFRSHKKMQVPSEQVEAIRNAVPVLQVDQGRSRSTLLIRTNNRSFDPSWKMEDVALEEIILAYLGRPATNAPVILEHNEQEISL
ncbi:MAG: ABC transporter ATP-binding protein, partial [Chloroflexota bacterium]|nr:ABC transporter ATP-binding protein [Chloroflexota bacterium]